MSTMQENIPSDMHPMILHQPKYLHSLISLHCPHEETASLAIQNASSEDSAQTV